MVFCSLPCPRPRVEPTWVTVGGRGPQGPLGQGCGTGWQLMLGNRAGWAAGLEAWAPILEAGPNLVLPQVLLAVSRPAVLPRGSALPRDPVLVNSQPVSAQGHTPHAAGRGRNAGLINCSTQL